MLYCSLLWIHEHAPQASESTRKSVNVKLWPGVNLLFTKTIKSLEKKKDQ